MNWSEFFSYLFTSLITAAVSISASLHAAKRSAVKAKTSDDVKFREQLMTEVQRLGKEVIVLKEQNYSLRDKLIENQKVINELELKISDQFNHIEILEAYYENMPGPAWMKDTNSMMFFINSSYEKVWGVTKLEYQGRTDEDVWGKEVSKSFVAHDNMVKQMR